MLFSIIKCNSYINFDKNFIEKFPDKKYIIKSLKDEGKSI